MQENVTRREKLFELMEENSAAIIFAGSPKIATADEEYPFKVNTNFFYLTNIQQENSVLLLVKGLGEHKTYLFVDEYSELKEKWTGRRITYEEARQFSDINSVHSTNDLNTFIELTLAKKDNQYGAIEKLYIDLTPEIRIKSRYDTVDFSHSVNEKFPHITVENIEPFLMQMRMVKSDYEIKCLKKAIDYTHQGIVHMLSNIRKNTCEYELADEFELYGRKIARLPLSFSTIVASGKNATILHYPYHQQNDVIDSYGLVLFDLGYSYNGYCADISRTYPVSGHFEGRAKLIYETVLKCNKAVIEYMHPGLTPKDVQEFSKEFLRNECLRVGLISEDEDIMKYYYHGVGHSLGLDTHDLQDRNRPYEVGNVITVEPGLYFAKYGIGVRIEDDVLITGSVNEVLSKDIAKEVKDIEKLLKNRTK